MRPCYMALLATLGAACGDSFSPSSVAGVYDRIDAPAMLALSTSMTTHNGQPALEERALWVDWGRYTLTAASNWTWEASRRSVVRVFDLAGASLVDSFDIPQFQGGAIGGSFTLTPPDSIFLSDSLSTTLPGTIVPPDLVVIATTFRRR